MKKQFLHLSLLFTALITSTAHAAAQPSTAQPATAFEDIKNQHISSFPLPPAKVERPDSEKTWWEKATRLDAPTFRPVQLCDYDNIMRAYSVMAPTVATMSQSILQAKSYKDLELFLGTGKREVNLLQLIKKTHLKESEIFLGAILANPLTDIKELQKRQTIIRTIAQDGELRTSLNTLFTELAAQHAAIMSFWGNEQQANRFFSDQQY